MKVTNSKKHFGKLCNKGIVSFFERNSCLITQFLELNEILTAGFMNHEKLCL